MTDQFSSEVKEWIKLSSWLKTAKEREAELRLKIVDELFGSRAIGVPTAGTYVQEFDGFEFKLRTEEQLELDQEKVASLSSRMTDIATAEGITITEPIFRWKASIDKKAYAIFPEPLKRVLNEGVTLKHGMPSLSVAPVKAEVEEPPIAGTMVNRASVAAALAIQQQAALNEAIGAAQIKRRRGRPAGSKNKAKE